jgi:small subunit ribosomal protein S1
MVTKPVRMYEPPQPDEAWWSALLSEEEKHGQPSSSGVSSRHVHPPKDAPAVRDARAERTVGNGDGVDWEWACALFERDETVCLEVSGFNRGGLLVEGNGLHGFVPISHLVEVNCQLDENERDARLEIYVGRSINLKVIECDPERGRIVLSERAALAASGRRNQLFDDIKPGDHVCGTVTNVTDFGVFVDLGGVEGLIHVSELSWGRVRHPADVASVGDEISAYVVQVDKPRSRIALSLKRLYSNPWETAEARYHPGEVVQAIITSIVSFGAFARLEEGLDGLIHATEFSRDLSDNSQIPTLTEGQVVRVRVLSVDASKQRLGLSLNLDE